MTKSKDLLNEMLQYAQGKLGGLSRKMAFEVVEMVAQRVEEHRERLAGPCCRATCQRVLEIVDSVRLEIE